jgi:hypothetical protein
MRQAQDGILPIVGGWAEQSAKLARLVDVATSERNKLAEAEARNAQARTKGNNGGTVRR